MPGAPRAVTGNLAGEGPQAFHRLMGALASAAGVGIVDEPALPAGFQVPHQQVVHHGVANVGGEDLPLLGFGHQKGQGGPGDVGATLQGPVQGQQVGFQIALEGQGIVGVALAPAALPVGAIEGLQAEERMPRPWAPGGRCQGRRGDHAPPRTGHTRLVLSLLSSSVLPSFRLTFHALSGLSAFVVDDQ
jgi:hypothetical protein